MSKQIMEYATRYGIQAGVWVEYVLNREHDYINFPNEQPFHFLHASVESVGLWCYYTAIGKREPTKIKPVKYIRRVFGDSLSDSEIQAIVEHATTGEVGAFKMINEDIEEYYMNHAKTGDTPAKGITGISFSYVDSSCMRYSADDFDSPQNPTVWYNTVPGLYLAVITDEDGKTLARTLCNTNKKQFSRVYGSSQESLEQLVHELFDRGYSYHELALNGLSGDKMERRNNEEQIIMPYLDGGNHCFDVIGDSVQINLRNGEYSADTTNGIVELTPGCCCSDCGDSMREEDSYSTHSGDAICDSCRCDHYWTCDSCNELFHTDDDHESDENNIYCERCFERYYESAIYNKWGDRYFVSQGDAITIIGDHGNNISDGDGIDDNYAEDIGTDNLANGTVDKGYIISDTHEELIPYKTIDDDGELVEEYEKCFFDDSVDGITLFPQFTRVMFEGETFGMRKDDAERFFPFFAYNADGIYTDCALMIPVLPGSLVVQYA